MAHYLGRDGAEWYSKNQEKHQPSPMMAALMPMETKGETKITTAEEFLEGCEYFLQGRPLQLLKATLRKLHCLY